MLLETSKICKLINFKIIKTYFFRFTAINGAQVLAEKWNGLADSIGGAYKTGEKWKKFWDDLK